MKTILQVLQYGEDDFRFKTDIDINKNPNILFQVLTGAAFSMCTSLWGGNEASVLAVIRALSIADLSVSVNRKEMIKLLDQESANLAKALNDTRKEFEKMGGKVMVFGPGCKPPKSAS